MNKRSFFLHIIVVAFCFGYRFREIGSCPVGGNCYDVIVRDTLAFLACDGLPVINLARPDSPYIACRLDSNPSYSTDAIWLQDSLIFNTNYTLNDCYLKVHNIKRIPQSILIDSILIPEGFVDDIEFKSGYLYLAEESLRIASAVNPESLQYLGIVDTTLKPWRLTGDGNYLYSEMVTGIFVYDLINPVNPIKISACSLTQLSGELYNCDSLIYVCCTPYATEHPIRICTINKRDPFNPFLLAQSSSIGQYVLFACDLTVSGNFAYATVACNLTDKGSAWRPPEQPQVAVFDISNPVNPQAVWIWEQEHGDIYRGIDSRADTIYICNGTYFTIYVDSAWSGNISENKNPKEIPRGMSVYPNPFRTKTNIRVNFNAGEIHAVNIYDTGGRRIKFLNIPLFNNAGSYEYSWDGTDNEGFKVSPGVYFIVMENGSRAPVRQKVVLFK
jgi:hypothetical protein